MATIPPQHIASLDRFVRRYLWEGLTTADTCDPVDSAAFADRSVQVVGTFDGATIVLEGSNDGGTTYATLKDAQGNAISFTAAGLKTVGDLADLVRPRRSVDGSGGCDVDIYLLMRAGNR